MNQKHAYGDLLLRKKGPVLHFGVHLGMEVAHIQPGSVLRTDSIGEFSQGQKINVMRKDDIDYNEVTSRFLEVKAKGAAYNLITNNCEHNANYILHGRKESPQVQAFALAAPVGVILARNQGCLGILLAGLVSGMAGVAICNAKRQHTI